MSTEDNAPSSEYQKTRNYALKLLDNLAKRQDAAKAEVRKKKAKADAIARKMAEERKRKDQEEARQEAQRIVDKSRGRTGVRRRRSSASSSQTSRKSPSQKRQSHQPRGQTRERRGSIGEQGSSSRLTAGVPKALPGMEFVVEKKQQVKRVNVVRNDYSDLFGDAYLKGIGNKMLLGLAKQSVEASKEARRIAEEKEEKIKKNHELAEQMLKQEREDRRLGISKTEKQRREERKKILEEKYITVDCPIEALPAKERKAFRDKLNRGAFDGVKHASTSMGNVVGSATKGLLGVAGGRVKKDDAPNAKKSLAKRKASLLQAVMSMGGAGSSSSARPTSSVEKREVKKPSSLSPGRGKKRSRYVDDDEDRDSARRKRRDVGSRRIAESRGRGRKIERGYNSDEWSDSQSDDDDAGGGGFGFNDLDELEEEEMVSSRYAKLEDKRERRRELKYKEDKEKRREAFERKRG